MELLDKGKHCEEEYCHQLDLLPMQCKACKKYFCSSHFKYESHNCMESTKLNYVIPTCELCNQTIEYRRDKNLDLCLAEHLQKCINFQRLNISGSKRQTSEKKKCSFKGCKSKEVFRFECESCYATFCSKHRLPEVHECANKRNSNARSCSQQQSSFESKNNHKKFTSYTVSSF